MTEALAFPCALCPDRFESEVARASHFAQQHPISDPDELPSILAMARDDEQPV